MDFKKVLGFLTKDFEKMQISYALIGGIALGALGIVRATVDVDFIVNRDDLHKVKRAMNARGYQARFGKVWNRIGLAQA